MVNPFSIQGIPMSRMERTIRILNGNAINREENVLGAPDSEIGAKGSFCRFLDLVRGIPSVDPFTMFAAFCYKWVCNRCGRAYIDDRVMEVNPVIIPMLYDEFFLSCSVDPFLKKVCFNIERAHQALTVCFTPILCNGCKNFIFIFISTRIDAISKTMCLFPRLCIKNHFTID